MSDTNAKKRLVVVGAGPGGYPAAYLAADLGFDVTLIDERAKPGGVCLHVGCIPSKAMLHVARLLQESAEATEWGLTFQKPDVDLDKLRGWKDSVVAKLTGGLGQMNAVRKVNFIQGRAVFADANHLNVETADGEQKTVEFDSAIIATGSRPARPGPLAIESPRIWDSTAALELRNIPETMLVIGGGYIGLEMGTVYAALGSQVSIVEMASELIPNADADLTRILKGEIERRFKEILLDTRVSEVKPSDAGVEVKLAGVDLENPTRTFDAVIVAVGRRPNTENIGLENLPGLKLTDRGFIEVDDVRRTGAENICAIGDVAGEPGLAHKATHEARVAVETLAGKPTAFDPRAIPAVVFTDPEMAWCGIMEEEARRRGIDYKVSKFPWAASGRAATVGRTNGLTKFIIDPHTDRIIGCGIVGTNAGDLISEASLAVELGATAEDMAKTIHPHPTFSETIMETADVYFGHSAHYVKRK